jgi:alpha-L-rhamnosidase
MYATIAGVDLDPLQPGYKHILIRPQPGGGLTHARATLHSMYGLIESAWRVEDGAIELNVRIPANSTATVRIPTSDASLITENGAPASGAEGVRSFSGEVDAATCEIGSGQYRFRAPLPASIK